jgi:sodium transport system permease protein
MNWHKTFAIFIKEMRDCMRDKRTVFSVLILPLILYPILIVGLNSVIMRQTKKLASKDVTYLFEDRVQDQNTKMIADSLARIPGLLQYSGTGQPAKLIKDRKIQVGIVLTRIDSLSGEFPVYQARLVYDGSDDRGKMAKDKMERIVDRLDKELVRIRMEQLQLSPAILDAVATKEDNVADKDRMLGSFIGKILPYFLIMLTLSGGMVISSDLMAGEKERKTLETLLVSGARRNEIVIGKYLAVITFSFVTVICNLVSIYLSMQQLMTQELETSGLHLPLGSVGLMILVMIPFISFISGLLLMVSTFSRNMKEAQSYLSPIMMGCMMLSFAPLLPGIDLNPAIALIPVVNLALLFKEILLQQFNLLHFSLVVGSTVVLDALTIWGMVKMFNNEATLFRVEEEKSLKFWGKNRTNAFSPGFAVVVFAILLTLLFYVGSKWQAKDITTGLMQTEVILIYLPAYLIFRITKTNVNDAVRLHMPKLSALGLAILAAVPVLILATKLMDLVNLVYPIPTDYLLRMSDLLRMKDSTLWMKLLVIGMMPGICEEFLFRGYFMSVFRKNGFWSSIIITAFMFAVFHLDPFRGIPVFFLGIWLGFLMRRADSIIVAMVAHALNNSLSILLGEYVTRVPSVPGLISDGQFTWLAGALAATVLAGIIALYLRVTRNEPGNSGQIPA